MTAHAYKNPAVPDAGQIDPTASNVVALRPDQQPAPARKARKPPKPGPIQRRPDEPHRIPLNVGLQATDKMKLLRVIARDDRLTDAQVRAAIPLVDLVHSEKGHSFFSWDYLGEQSGLGWQTAKRATDRLKELGYVNVDHIQGGVVHTSLNLAKIDTPKPDRKRTLSRDEAREKAAAKKAGKVGGEVSDRTSPSQRQELPEATASQRQMVPLGMYGQTSPEVSSQTSGEMYGQTSGEMYGQTSKSEIPLGEVIQRSPIGDQNQNEGCATATPPDRVRVSDDWEPAGKRRAFIPRDELGAAYQQITDAFLGNSSPIAGSTYHDHRGAVAGVLMQGFTVEQIVARMKPHNDRLATMADGRLHLLKFLREEFDFNGRYERELSEMVAAEVKVEPVERKRIGSPSPIAPRPVAEPAPSRAAAEDRDEDRREDRRKVSKRNDVIYGEPQGDEEFVGAW